MSELHLPPLLANAPAEVISAFKSLSGKMRAFALSLPVSASQEAAALAADYAPATARKKASAMAADPAVRVVVDWMLGQAVSRSRLTVERLMEEIEHIAFADHRDLYDKDTGALLPMHKIPESVARTISGVEMGDRFKVSHWDKLGAIEKALKLLNAYPEKKQQTTHTIVGVVIVPAKGQYKHPSRPVIEGQAREVKRVEPEPSKGRTFKVARAD